MAPRIKNSTSQFLFDYRVKTNWKYFFFALVLFIVLHLLALSIDTYVSDQIHFKFIIVSILYTLASTAAVFLIWEVAAKKTFMKEVINLTNLSNNLVSSGIEYYYENFRDIDWRVLLSGQKEFIICIVYGDWFYRRVEDQLKKFHKNGGKITIIFPDFNNEEVISMYARRFHMPIEKVIEHIVESIAFFERFDPEIFLFEGNLQNSYYKIGDLALISFFNHQKEQSTVPAILLGKDGDMYNYVLGELSAIKDRSTKYVKEQK